MAKSTVLTRSKIKKGRESLSSNNLVKAKEIFIKLCKSNPRHAEAWMLLGIAEWRMGNQKQAVEHLYQADELASLEKNINVELSMTFKEMGLLPEATKALSRVSRERPDYVDALEALSTLYIQQNNLDDALSVMKILMPLKPNSAGLRANIGSLLQGKMYLSEAEHYYLEAQSIDPDIAFQNLGGVYQAQGKIPQAIDCLQKGILLEPKNPVCHANLLSCLNYLPAPNLDDVYKQHLAGGDNLSSVPPITRPASRSWETGRPLKIGYVSGDFRTHSVVYFFKPLLAAHDREMVEHV